MSDVGTKHTCWQCDTRFYDFNKPEPACPRCGADPTVDPHPCEPFSLEERHGLASIVMDVSDAPVPADWFEDYGMAGSPETWQVVMNAIAKRQDTKLAKRIQYACDEEHIAARGELEDVIHLAYSVKSTCDEQDKLAEVVKKIPKRQRK